MFGAPRPDAFLDASPEVLERSQIDADAALLDEDGGPRHFVRGHLVLPVRDGELGQFVWSVWVELSAEAIDEVRERWDRPDRASLPAVPVRLDARSLPYEPPVVGLRALLRDREPGTVPLVLVEGSSSHPLADEQRDGITAHRVAQLNALVLG